MKQTTNGSPTPHRIAPTEGPETATHTSPPGEKEIRTQTPAAQLIERAKTIRLLARERECLRDEKETRQSELNEIQKRTVYAVETEYDRTGAKELSNAEKRKRSAEQRLEHHRSYQRLALEEKTLHKKIVLQGIELSFQRRLFMAELAEILQNGLIPAILSRRMA